MTRHDLSVPGKSKAGDRPGVGDASTATAPKCDNNPSHCNRGPQALKRWMPRATKCWAAAFPHLPARSKHPQFQRRPRCRPSTSKSP
eukprot:5410200-Alexandrium_andersonii.AAC.1